MKAVITSRELHSLIIPRQMLHYQQNTKQMPDTKTVTRGRDARTGEFTTVKEARQQPNTHVVERVPKPGRGDTKK